MIGIVTYEFHDDTLSCSTFTTCNEVLAVPSEHPLAVRDSVGLRDLAGERLVVLGDADPYRHRLEKALAAADVVPGTLTVTDSSTTACSLALCGVGIAVVNPITALELVSAGLVIRALPELDAPYVTTLVHRHDVHPTGLVRRFLEVVKKVRDRELTRANELSEAVFRCA